MLCNDNNYREYLSQKKIKTSSTYFLNFQYLIPTYIDFYSIHLCLTLSIHIASFCNAVGKIVAASSKKNYGHKTVTENYEKLNDSVTIIAIVRAVVK